MMFVYTMSISSQTALSTSTRRLAAHIVPALSIHPREIQTLWSNNRDIGSYDTLYEVYRVAIMHWYVGLWQAHMLYQIDRQQYDEHTPNTSCKIQTSYASRRYDAWCKYFVSNRSFNKHSYTSTVYQVDNSKNDVVIYLTMTGTHVVPDTSSILDYDKHTRCTG